MATTNISIKIDSEAQHAESLNDQHDQNQQHFKLGNYEVGIDEEQLPIVGVEDSAVVLLIVVDNGYLKKYIKEYGFSIGAVALIIALLRLIPNDSVGRYYLHLNYFLFIDALLVHVF